ncbi:hypothetical protein LCGC14_2940770 [marine sediment metagenome]|uniref:Uncharacterized protein n=1 Tax=marine sediment metagenome TaxID=412755 RepID=A0A0F8XI03_9ZZZZ
MPSWSLTGAERRGGVGMGDVVRTVLRRVVVTVGLAVAILGWVWMIVFVMAYGN